MTLLLQVLHHSFLGVQVMWWLAGVAVFLIEAALGRSKNPKVRSLADAIAVLLDKMLRPTLGRVPLLGTVIGAALDLILPAAAKAPAGALPTKEQ